MAEKYLPQNKVGASRTKPMPERRSGANLTGPTGRQRPDTTSSPRASAAALGWSGHRRSSSRGPAQGLRELMPRALVRQFRSMVRLCTK